MPFVIVKSGMTGKDLGLRAVRKVSRTGRVVTLAMPEYATGEAKFYQQVGNFGGSLGVTYVETPGSGMCGSMLNNRFTVEKVLEPGIYVTGLVTKV